MLQQMNSQTNCFSKSNTMGNTNPKEREIWYANLPFIGHQQGGIRPVLIISNDAYNKFSPMVWALPITSQTNKSSPVHVKFEQGSVVGLNKPSVVLVESIWNIDKNQLMERVGYITEEQENKIAEKMFVQCPMLQRKSMVS